MTKLVSTFISFTFLFVALTVPHCRCDDWLDSPPAPPVSSPTPSHSPPGPRSVNLAPETSPGPSPSGNGPINGFHHSPSPAPAPVAADLNHEAIANFEAAKENFEAAKDSSNGRTKGGSNKAGITVGVIAGVCVVGLGAMVYKKRQQNIRRAQYGYTARIELL